MKIEVNISKKYLIIIIAVVVIAAAIVGVIANHGTSTPNPGHDLEEIGGIPTCGAGEVLTHTGIGLTCVTDQTGGGVGSLDQKVFSKTGTTGTVVSDPCSSGYIRSGCSGGNVGANENYRIGPSGSNKCEITGVVGHEKNIVIYCVRLS